MPSNGATLEDKNNDIVLSVLSGSPFKIRPDEEKKTIIQKGRPLPSLNIVKRDTGNTFNGSFQASWYSSYKWLCGSQNFNKLFCWPCLLMRPESSSWCSTGNDDLKKFTSLASKHGTCKSHAKAIAEYDEILKKFGLHPEYVDELIFKLKEEEGISSEKMEINNFHFNNLKKKEVTADNTSNSKYQLISEAESSTNISQSSDMPSTPKAKTLITFKTWQEISKNSFPLSKSKYLEDAKLFKWKKKIAQQELKNARLTEEKLRFEIEVLKAKVEYYKSLKEEVNKNDERFVTINTS